MSGKPLGHKNYGSIPHLSGSRMGPADRKCHEGQKRIACIKARNKYDRVIVQEKLDGSNVGVARISGKVYALTRAGFLANTSPYLMHHLFALWVSIHRDRFLSALSDGERMCGEWMLVAHGTRYDLPHEPFVAFDIMHGKTRLPYEEFIFCTSLGGFITPYVISDGPPLDIDTALTLINGCGFHGALEPVEGVVWRVERDVLNDKHMGNAAGRHTVVDFLVKYVRPDKVDGKYLSSELGKTIYNNHR